MQPSVHFPDAVNFRELRLPPHARDYLSFKPPLFFRDQEAVCLGKLKRGEIDGAEAAKQITLAKLYLARVVLRSIPELRPENLKKHGVAAVALGGDSLLNGGGLSDLDLAFVSRDAIKIPPDWGDLQTRVQDGFRRVGLQWKRGDKLISELAETAANSSLTAERANQQELYKLLTSLPTMIFLDGSKEVFDEYRRAFYSEIFKGPNFQNLFNVIFDDKRRRLEKYGREMLPPYAQGIVADMKDGEGGFRDASQVLQLQAMVTAGRAAGFLPESFQLLPTAMWDEFQRAYPVLFGYKIVLHGLKPDNTKAEDANRFDRATLERVCANYQPRWDGKPVPSDKRTDLLVSLTRTVSATLRTALSALPISHAFAPIEVRQEAELRELWRGVGSAPGRELEIVARGLEAFQGFQQLVRFHHFESMEAYWAAKDKHEARPESEKQGKEQPPQRPLLSVVASERRWVFGHLKNSIGEMVGQIAARAGDPQDFPVRELHPDAKRAMTEILSVPGFVALALEDMHEIGLLDYALPAFGRLRNVSEKDNGHHLLHNRHALDSVGYADAILRCENDILLPGLLLNGFQDLKRLHETYLGILLHDAGKRPEEPVDRHREWGAELAYKTAISLGFDEQAAGRVSGLVLNHITLRNLAAQPNHGQLGRAYLRQLEDPQNLGLAHDEEFLFSLALLTLVDLRTNRRRAVDEAVCLSVADVVNQVLHEIRPKSPDHSYLTGTTTRIQNAERAYIAEHPEQGQLSEVEIAQHIIQTSGEFNGGHKATDLYHHVRLISELRKVREDILRDSAGKEPARPLPVARLYWYEPGSEFSRASIPAEQSTKAVKICTASIDREGHFASLCGAMWKLGYSIKEASGFTRRDGFACNTFLVDIPKSSQVQFLARGRPATTLEQAAAADQGHFEEIVQARKAGMKRNRVPSKVEVENDPDLNVTKVHIETHDQNGLGCLLSHSLTNFDTTRGKNQIVSVNLGVGARGVRDIFYIRNSEGQMLDPAKFSDLTAHLSGVMDGTRT